MGGTAMIKFIKEFKEKHPDVIFLCRCGDFYEMYCEDAVICSELLGIKFTMRDSEKVSMFPYHALDMYLPKLVRAGRRVCICDKIGPTQNKNWVTPE